MTRSAAVGSDKLMRRLYEALPTTLSLPPPPPSSLGTRHSAVARTTSPAAGWRLSDRNTSMNPVPSPRRGRRWSLARGAVIAVVCVTTAAARHDDHEHDHPSPATQQASGG